MGVGANHIWCKNIPKEHIKLKKLDLVQHSGSPIPISPLVCTLHVEGCTAQSMGVHKYATYTLHRKFSADGNNSILDGFCTPSDVRQQVTKNVSLSS